jgi:hypothetical protein
LVVQGFTPAELHHKSDKWKVPQVACVLPAIKHFNIFGDIIFGLLPGYKSICTNSFFEISIDPLSSQLSHDDQCRHTDLIQYKYAVAVALHDIALLDPK